MTQGRGLDLAADADTPLIAHGADTVTRGALAALADELAAAMAARGATRLLVRSDDPRLILAALDISDRASVDVFVAHTNLAQEHIDAICEAHHVQLVLGEGRIWRDAASAPASGRVFMMTSGTTGKPKIASHSLQSLLARVRPVADQPANRGGRWLLTYQHTGFAGVQVLLTAALSRSLLVVPEMRSPAGFSEAAKRWDVTQISATPTFWRAFLMAAKPSEMNLKQITLGGEAADQATLDRVGAAFPNARVTHTYASTEAGVVYAVHDGREGFPATWLEDESRPTALRIRDGFLQIKNVNAMRGYLEADKQPLLDDGWLATADRAEVEGDRVRVIGRDDSTINVGGSKVYPLAVETFLLQQPGVIEARVYGAANPISGFLVAADVVLSHGVDAQTARRDILAACREKLPGYQVPRVFKVVDAIEVRASGKKG